MREILFRGFSPNEHGTKTIMIYGEKIRGDWVEGDLQHNICTTKIREKDKDIERIAKSYSIIPNTASQYTGLADKNGVRIFEEDKVLFLGQECEIALEIGAFGVVNAEGFNYEKIGKELKQEEYCFNNYSGCHNDNFISLWEIYWNFNNEEACIDEIEVIGNIWEVEG